MRNRVSNSRPADVCAMARLPNRYPSTYATRRWTWVSGNLNNFVSMVWNTTHVSGSVLSPIPRPWMGNWVSNSRWPDVWAWTRFLDRQPSTCAMRRCPLVNGNFKNFLQMVWTTMLEPGLALSTILLASQKMRLHVYSTYWWIRLVILRAVELWATPRVSEKLDVVSVATFWPRNFC